MFCGASQYTDFTLIGCYIFGGLIGLIRLIFFIFRLTKYYIKIPTKIVVRFSKNSRTKTKDQQVFFFSVVFNSLMANERILQLIMQSLNGNATAQRILVSLGRPLIDALFNVRIITVNQAIQLYELFGLVGISNTIETTTTTPLVLPPITTTPSTGLRVSFGG